MSVKSLGSAISATTAGAGAVEIGADMDAQRQYQVTAKDAGIWIHITKTGAGAATVKGADCHYVPMNTTVPVAAIGDRNRVSFLRDGGSTDATCTLAQVVGLY